MSKENLYKLEEKLGMNKNDIDDVQKHRTVSDKHASLSLGSDEYKDEAYYGTVSINDF